MLDQCFHVFHGEPWSYAFSMSYTMQPFTKCSECRHDTSTENTSCWTCLSYRSKNFSGFKL